MNNNAGTATHSELLHQQGGFNSYPSQRVVSVQVRNANINEDQNQSHIPLFFSISMCLYLGFLGARTMEMEDGENGVQEER